MSEQKLCGCFSDDAWECMCLADPHIEEGDEPCSCKCHRSELTDEDEWT